MLIVLCYIQILFDHALQHYQQHRYHTVLLARSLLLVRQLMCLVWGRPPGKAIRPITLSMPQ